MAFPGWLGVLANFASKRGATDSALGSKSMEMATRVSIRLDTLCAKVDRMEEQQELQRELLYIHADWDRELVGAAREAGIPVSTPPPLFLSN